MKKNDQQFVCVHCGAYVPKLRYTSRNHCPHCLYSLHVDIEPGDRANECRGELKPVAIETSGKKGYIVVHKCLRCGKICKNKCAEDDDFNTILAISRDNANNSAKY